MRLRPARQQIRMMAVDAHAIAGRPAHADQQDEHGRVARMSRSAAGPRTRSACGRDARNIKGEGGELKHRRRRWLGTFSRRTSLHRKKRGFGTLIGAWLKGDSWQTFSTTYCVRRQSARAVCSIRRRSRADLGPPPIAKTIPTHCWPS